MAVSIFKILEYKHIRYEDEDGWHMDYPDVKTIVKRFREQGVLTDSQIKRCIVNTSLIEEFEDYKLGGMEIVQNGDDFYLDAPIKLPTLYPELSIDERNKIFKDIINKEWKKYVKAENIIKEDFPKYIEGIKYEVEEIVKCGMADYFLTHYQPMKDGVEKYGGKITKRGRGSAVSYFINTLLGFSKVDRFKTPIKLYPERFITADRILKSKAIPDIDNNIDRQEPFVRAFRDYLGEHSIYPMISFKPLRKSSAIKLYMGAEGIDSVTQNEVTKGLKLYEKALKHCETDEERDEIDIKEYIDEQYHHFINDSKPYQGIIMTKSQHACAHLLISGDIRREIGLFKCISENSKKEVMTCCIEGSSADHYKFCKTDLLIVDVVGLTEAIWERIGEPSPSNNKLEEMLRTEDKGAKAWDMYAKGLTLCVNQCEQEGTRSKCKKYKMKNTGELSAFVAGVRPAFKSLLTGFLNRETYSTGIPKLDELLKDSYHYMLYQESIMAYLSFLGIDMKETYDIIKKIAKKKFKEDELKELKTQLLSGWVKNVGKEDGFNETWQVIEDAAHYSFNASHSLSVAIDSLYGAYLKAKFPSEYFTVALSLYSDDLDRTAKLIAEMPSFGLSLKPIKFRHSRADYNMEKETQSIYKSLSSLKYMNKDVSEQLYSMKDQQFNSFIDLLSAFPGNSRQREILIRLNYFSEFGGSLKLIKIAELYDTYYGKKIIKKDKCDLPLDVVEKYAASTTEKQYRFEPEGMSSLLSELCDRIPDEELPILAQIEAQKEYLGYIDLVDPSKPTKAVILDVNTKYTPKLSLYRLYDGQTISVKLKKKDFECNPVASGMIIDYRITKKPAWKKEGEDWVQDYSREDIWLTSYSIE